jgi:hypothetical protein
MGYDLNIVRPSIESSNISREEWMRYATNDEELTTSAEANLFQWIGYPYIKERGIPWFEFRDGYITTKNPDFDVIKKLLSIAQSLNAKVQGEEGEFYEDDFLNSIE